MNDLDTFVAMLKRARIEHAIDDERVPEQAAATILYAPLTKGKRITVVGGYCHFYTIFDFDHDGKLVAIGAFE